MKPSQEKPRRRVKSSLVGASEAFDELVHQFTDPLAFLRELIQNSLDAASTRIEVRFAFEGSEDEGLARVEVQDNGEGMDERIIDDYLLTLFRSTKEGDQTKIGKFGIGFVSVFALEPELVVVETGRSGEAWQLGLHPGGRFEKIRLSAPVEGTTVRLLKRASRRAFEELGRRGREAVRFWCRYAECDILVDGQPIREPFALDAPLAVRHAEEGTELWVGFAPCADGETLCPQVGLFNRGLTLRDSERLPGADDLAGLSMRVRSRHLEHTLTRDDVRQDEGYSRLLALIRRVVAEALRPRLVAHLVALARGEAAGGPPPQVAYLYARLPCMDLGRVLGDEPVLPVVEGPPLGVAALRGLEGPGGALLLSAGDDRATRLARAQGFAVLRDLGGLAAFLPRLSARPVWTVQQVFCAPAPAALEEGWEALCRRVAALLDEVGAKVEGVHLGALEPSATAWVGRAALRQREAFGLTRPGEDDRAGPLGGARQVVLLRGHPTVERGLALARSQPGLAALVLGASVLLAEGAGAERVATLARACLPEAADGA